MDSYFYAVIMGIVEGLTEFLPVSSTGHLILTGELLGLDGASGETFEIVIQVGAMFAVVLCYFNRFWGLLFPQKEKKKSFSGLRGITLLMVTTLPGAFFGLLFHSFIKTLFTPLYVAIALFVGAIFMLVVEKIKFKAKYASIDDIDYKTALGIGLFQCCALWPGFSRSASTICGGMILGLKREIAAEYSFLAAVPIIVGAACYDLFKSYSLILVSDIPFFVVGTVVSFLSALVAIKGFIAMLSKVGLTPFAVYRLLLVVPVYYFMVY